MRNKLLVALAVAAAALLAVHAGLSYWFGREAERIYNAYVQSGTQTGQLTLEPGPYKRGIYSSTGTGKITGPAIPVVFSISTSVSHGPLPFAALRRGRFVPALAAMTAKCTVTAKSGTGGKAAEILQAMPPFDAFTLVGFDGTGATHLEAPASKTSLKDGTEIDIEGFSGDFVVSADLKRTQGSLGLPGFQVRDGGQKVTATKGTVETDMTQGPTGVQTGETHLKVERVALDEGEQSILLSGLDVTMRIEDGDGTLSQHLEVSLQEANAAGSTYGPGRLALDVRNLDIEAMQRFQQMTAGMQDPAMPPEQMMAIVASQGQQILTDLLRRGPEMEIGALSLKTPDGELRGSARVAVTSVDPAIAQNPFLILNAIRGRADLALPKSMVEAMAMKRYALQNPSGEPPPRSMAAMLTRQFAESTHLFPDGASYRVNLVIEKGEILVNGEPIFPPSLSPMDPGTMPPSMMFPPGFDQM